MIDVVGAQRTLDLHERSFRLFLWLNQALKSAQLKYSSMEVVLTSADAAKSWLTANMSNLPSDLRPSGDDLEAFSSHFVSFINTSFEIVDPVDLPNCRGCVCCCFHRAGPKGKHLKVRSLGSHAKETALELKRICVQNIARESGREISVTEAKEFIVSHPILAESITLAAYVQELARRMTASSQGEAVLALWRELSDGFNKKISGQPRKPPRGRPAKKKKYELTARRVVDAEQAIAAKLKECV